MEHRNPSGRAYGLAPHLAVACPRRGLTEVFDWGSVGRGAVPFGPPAAAYPAVPSRTGGQGWEVAVKSRGTNRFVKAAVGVVGVALLGWLVYALSPEVRCFAAATLGRSGPPAAPLLIRMLGDHDGRVTAAAITALAEIGPGAVPTLSEALTHPDPATRRWAATVLGTIGPPAMPAAPALFERLGTEDDAQAQESAAGALGRIGREDADIRQKLIELLRQTDARLRAAAAEGLGHMRAFAKPAVPALIQALRDADKTVRNEAEEALERIQRVSMDDAPLRQQIDAALRAANAARGPNPPPETRSPSASGPSPP
jgi:hypothetical protein